MSTAFETVSTASPGVHCILPYLLVMLMFKSTSFSLHVTDKPGTTLAYQHQNLIVILRYPLSSTFLLSTGDQSWSDVSYSPSLPSASRQHSSTPHSPAKLYLGLRARPSFCAIGLERALAFCAFQYVLQQFHWQSFTANTDTQTANRFEVLSSPPRASTRSHRSIPARPHHLSRNSRGSKQGKKRRDARRNERKWAAYLLNEQLSMRIDETLRQAEFYPPPKQYLPSSAPVCPAFVPSKVHAQPSNALVRYTPPRMPPRLPELDFNRFEIQDFATSTPRFTPVSSPCPSSADVPRWCPAVPRLRLNEARSNERPLFFDLSSLPEPKTTAPAVTKLQELELWRDKLNFKPRQSRFFPSRSLQTPVIKLPRISCKLREPDKAYQDADTQTRPLSMPDISVDSPIEAGEKTSRNPEIQDSKETSSTAANLWKILMDDMPDEKISNRYFQPLRGDEEYTSIAAAESPVAELDGLNVPYVHSNSLTGHANHTAAGHADRGSLSDSMALMANMFVHNAERSLETLEANCMDSSPEAKEADLIALPLLPEMSDTSPSSPPAEQKNASVEDSPDLTVTDAHFLSEQDLFERPLPPSPSASVCDLATFLTMGHVENCWCRDCDENCTLVGNDTLTEDEGWMVWSSAGIHNDRMSTPATVFETWTENVDANEDPSPIVNTSAPSWDDFFPCPTIQPRGEPKLEGIVDGDHASLADLSGEYDWCWDF